MFENRWNLAAEYEHRAVRTLRNRPVHRNDAEWIASEEKFVAVGKPCDECEHSAKARQCFRSPCADRHRQRFCIAVRVKLCAECA